MLLLKLNFLAKLKIFKVAVEPILQTNVFVLFLRNTVNNISYHALIFYNRMGTRAEKEHHHITETDLAMLFNASVPTSFWINAFTSATYTINCLPSKIIAQKFPFEMLINSLPNYDVFRAIGCRVFPYLRNYSANKLAPRNTSCIFILYNPHYKGYHCLDPTSNRVY